MKTIKKILSKKQVIIFLIFAFCSLGSIFSQTYIFSPCQDGLQFSQTQNYPTHITVIGVQGPPYAEGNINVFHPYTNQLLFYSKGENIYNKNHQLMQYGTGLLLNNDGAQCIVCCPVPNTCFTKFWLIHNTAQDLIKGSLYVSQVEINQSNPLGLVTQKNDWLCDSSDQSMVIVPKMNSDEFYLVMNIFNSATYKVYRITNSQIVLENVYHGSYTGISYQMTYNNGKLAVSGCSDSQTKHLVIFDFDPLTGVLSNETLFFPNDQVASCFFSPDNTKIYLVKNNVPNKPLFQYDFASNTLVQVPNTCCKGHDLMLVNGRLYYIHTHDSPQPFGVIDFPNSTAANNLCHYHDLQLSPNWQDEIRRFPTVLTLPASPIANLDIYNVNGFTETILTVLDNDVDPQGDSIFIDSIIMAPLHGTALIDGTTIIYHPDSGTCENDTIIYQITDNCRCQKDTAIVILQINYITPVFNSIGPYCSGTIPETLPLTSVNGITGSWSPDSISTLYPGTTTYTFNAGLGQCATTATMNITVNPGNITPTFTQLGPYCAGATPPGLPATSTNGITGTWNPSTISTASPGTTQYTFTPNTGQCAVNATMDITVTPSLTAYITGNTPICIKTSPGVLTVVASGGGGPGTYSYLWYQNGISTGVTANTYDPGMIIVNTNFYCAVTSTACGTVNTPTFTVVVLPAVGTPTPITISSGTEPTCQLTNGTTTTTYSTTANNASSYNWSINNPAAGSINSSGVMTWANGFYGTVTIQVSANGCEGPTITVTRTVVVGQNASIGSVTGTTPLCMGSTATYTANSVVLGGGTGSWSSSNINIATVNSSGVVTPVSEGNCNIIYTINGACGSPVIAQQTVYVYAVSAAGISISASPGTVVCEGTLVTFTATGINGGSSPVYQWYIDGAPVGGNDSTFSSSTLAMGNMVSCQFTSNETCVTGSPATSNVINMLVKPSLTAFISISTPTNPACTHALVTFNTYIENGGTTPQYQWYVNGSLQSGATNSTYSTINLGNGNTVSCVLNSNEACILSNSATSNTITMMISPVPEANAGTNATYSGTPIQIGSVLNGPGNIIWNPPAGLDNPTSAQPNASPSYTTVYTISVDNNGCVRTDDVVITVAGSGYMVSGKTMYAGKAIAGNPAPTPPAFNPMIYDINKVIVILKNQSGTELARDTTDAWGTYSFSNIPNGNYTLSYDKYTPDTMQWVNEVNAVDIALLKYNVTANTLLDPSRNFMTIHKKAANVDNNAFINAVDIARIKAKVASPYDPTKNFPKGNWVNLDSAITVSNANVSVILPVIAYGDYNASSSKYKDSSNTWSQAKSLPVDGMIVTSEEFMVATNGELIEVPLRISGKVNDFSAMGLELTYNSDDYRLVSAGMPNAGKDNESVKPNPTLDEIIENDNDLLVTENKGVIRVVYATTDHYNVAENDLVLTLGFKVLKLAQPGEADLKLQGTGVIADQYGREPENTYLEMPKIFVQGTNIASEFEFTAYPNPFKDNVTLSYNLLETGKVTLQVYNAIGEQVMEVINQQHHAGKHSAEFQADKLPAGLYILKLEFEYQGTSKVALLKIVK